MSATKPISRVWTARLAVGLVTITLVACLLGSCTAARSNLGTSSSSCYLALPAATKAVGSQGRLLGVRLYSMKALRQKSPQLFKIPAREHNSRQRVCVIEFVGHFTNTSVSKPLGRPSGRLAIVALEAPSNQLLGTVILDHPPLQFGHSHIG
jgi:hypothetical protein